MKQPGLLPNVFLRKSAEANQSFYPLNMSFISLTDHYRNSTNPKCCFTAILSSKVGGTSTLETVVNNLELSFFQIIYKGNTDSLSQNLDKRKYTLNAIGRGQIPKLFLK